MPPARSPRPKPRRVLLILRGFGAVGGYHAGVYRAMHEAGVEPDWIIATGFGALTGGILASNPPHGRLSRIDELWGTIAHFSPVDRASMVSLAVPGFGDIGSGIPGLFVPNVHAALGADAPVGLARSGLYSFPRIEDWLLRLVDFDALNHQEYMRLTLAIVNARSGNLHYRDNHRIALGWDSIFAAVAVPPFFAPVPLEGELYWSGELIGGDLLRMAELSDDAAPTHVISVSASARQAEGLLTLRDAALRQQQMRASFRDRTVLRDQSAQRKLLAALARSLELSSPAQRARLLKDPTHGPWFQQALAEAGRPPPVMVQLLPPPAGGPDDKDLLTFTEAAVQTYRQQGYQDMNAALADQIWQ